MADEFWRGRLDINRTETIPFMLKKCEETGESTAGICSWVDWVELCINAVFAMGGGGVQVKKLRRALRYVRDVIRRTYGSGMQQLF